MKKTTFALGIVAGVALTLGAAHVAVRIDQRRRHAKIKEALDSVRSRLEQALRDARGGGNAEPCEDCDCGAADGSVSVKVLSGDEAKAWLSRNMPGLAEAIEARVASQGATDNGA